MTAAHLGQLATLWLILSGLVWLLLYGCHRFNQSLERQEFWEEMQEYMDGTHPSQEDKR